MATKGISDELRELASDLGGLARDAKSKRIGMQPLADRLFDLQTSVDLLADKAADSEVVR